MEKIEERKIVPIAAMISAGKSKLLNVILNTNFLESKSGIGTKFVNILRYNPKIVCHKFYHLKLKEEKGKFNFYKDNEYKVIEGEDNIKEENMKINKELSEKKMIDYNDIFYITEINSIGFIKDENYMTTHDLCDIPGLSEYQEQNNEDNKKNQIIEQKEENLEEKLKKGQEFGMIYKPKNLEKEKQYLKDKIKEEDDIFYNIDVENESTYLTEIYKRIKDYIDGAIIVFSIENYYFSQNIEIIAKLHKIINKKIKNFLIILNKIDKSTDPKNDIESCKGFLFNAFPKCQTFNLNINTFIPISAYQVENELLMEDNFSNLIYYYFYDFKKNIMNEKLLTNIIPHKNKFIDYLREILKKVNISKHQIENAIDELNIKEDISKLNDEIKKIIINLNNISKGELEIGIGEDDFKNEDDDEEDFLSSLKSQKNKTSTNNIDDVEPLSIIKMIYILHKKKELILKKSNETIQLLNYFTTSKGEEDNYLDSDIETTLNDIELNNQIIKALQSFYYEFQTSESNLEQIQNLSHEVQKLIEYLKIYDVIFVPFFGASNSGKSTIINGMIGKDLLPCDLRECTKRGIIIRYSDEEPVIKKADFLEEDFLNKKHYYFRAENIIGKGEYQIQQTLKGLNYKFNEKEEDSFYYIKTRIKLFDDLGLDKSLKEMIYLIDFPGYGTGNFFEKEICNKVISICNSFIFVSRNSVIKSKETKFALDSFIKAKENTKKFSSQLIKSSIFVFNIDVEQTSNNEDIEKAKEDILELIKGIDREDIKLSFYNAKFYLTYCSTYNYFYNWEKSMKDEYDNYTYMNSSYFLPTNKEKVKSKFPQHLLDLLIEKASKFNAKMKKSQKYDIEIEESINKFFKDIGEENNENKNNIIKIVSFCKENIDKLNLYEESKVESFKEVLKSQIKYVNEKKQKELRKNIYNILSTLDLFFGKNFEKKKKDIQEINDFKNKMKDLKNQIQILIKDNIEKYKNIITDFKSKILLSLYEMKRSMEEKLKKYDYKLLISGINIELEKCTNFLIKNIQDYIGNIDSKCNDIFKQILETINNFSENKIKNSTKYNYKRHLSNAFSNGEKDINTEIMTEIKEKCESMSNIWNKKGFKEWLLSFFSNHFMENVIDMIIETYSDKIENFLKMIVDESNNYLNEMISTINNHISSSTMKFNDIQRKKWEQICESYKETKEKIIELEKKSIK